MPSRTLSPTALRSSAPPRRESRVLVVVGGSDMVLTDRRTPDWVQQWTHRAGWDVQWHPATGPLGAGAAARMDGRVLLLRAPEQHAATRTRPPRVVAALQGLPDDGPVVADAAACAARAGVALTLVHAVPRSFAERSVGLEGALAAGQRLLDAATDHVTVLERHVPVTCELLRMHPYELVGEALDAHLLVVGGRRPDRPDLGLVAHSALHHAPCPVLIVPR
jgi:nucleotide-binding universal stress UspA family protein